MTITNPTKPRVTSLAPQFLVVDARQAPLDSF